MISKAHYKLHLKCAHEAWIAYNRPESLPAPDASAQLAMQQGNEVDVFAQSLFQEAKFLRELKLQEKEIHFQYKVTADDFVTIADIVAIAPNSKRVDIFEVKASKDYDKVIGEYTEDAAFQAAVFERAGYIVERVYIIYLDHKYIYPGGKVRAMDFFRHPNISEAVHKKLPQVQQQIDELKAFLSQNEPVYTPFCCSNKLDCSALQQHYGELIPEYSIFDIARITPKKLNKLIAQDIWNISDIPSDFDLSDNQRKQVELAQKDEIYIDRVGVQAEKKKWSYPYYFLDYETLNLVFPTQKGYKPYGQMVFQYSLHILDTVDSPLRHAEYLLDAADEPVHELLASLQSQIAQDGGTIFVWNQSFEAGRNREMATIFPEYADFLEDVNSRIYDLAIPFQHGLYVHPRFKGSYSIKAVLPVLVPHLSYASLVVANGSLAMSEWHRMVRSTLPMEEKTALRQHLLAYCKMDTLAMVELLHVLQLIE